MTDLPPPPPPSPFADRSIRSSSSASLNLVRLCGTSRSACGYCQGDRASVLADETRTSLDCSQAYGLLVSRLSPDDYERLIGHGWRRSGLHLYKPDNFHSCCPALTIRLPVNDFRPTKSQRRDWNKMEKALRNCEAASPESTATSTRHPAEEIQTMDTGSNSDKGSKRAKTTKSYRTSSSTSSPASVDPKFLERLQNESRIVMKSILSQNHPDFSTVLDKNPVKYKLRPSSGKRVVLVTTICAALAGQSKGALQRDELCCSLAEGLRQRYHLMEDCNRDDDQEISDATMAGVLGDGLSSDSLLPIHIAAHEASGQVVVTVPPDAVEATSLPVKKNEPASLDKIGRWLQTARARIPPSVTAASSSSPERCRLEVTTLPALDSALQPDVHQLYFHYQHKVHGDPDVLGLAQSKSNGTSALEENDKNSSSADSESNEEDWGEADATWIERAKRMLTREYGPSAAPFASFTSFYRFLVESPLPRGRVHDTEERQQCALGHEQKTKALKPLLSPGTYHQQYRIRGQLLAVGVVDVLPNGLSSVYVFYDPDFARSVCPMGRYTSLYEIQVVQKYRLGDFYYLGYYIESCPKMRYKAEYHPSQLLCPTRYKWVDAELAQAILRKHSPKRHCCTLYRHEHESEAMSVSNRHDKFSEAVNKSNDDKLLNRIPLDVGRDSNIVMNVLHPQGKDIVRPLLQEFFEHVGTDIAGRCIVKLV